MPRSRSAARQARHPGAHLIAVALGQLIGHQRRAAASTSKINAGPIAADSARYLPRRQLRSIRRFCRSRQPSIGSPLLPGGHDGIATPLGASITQRGAGDDHPRQLAAARLGEHIVEPSLSAASGHLARRRPPRPLHADPIFFWTCRPSGSRCFAYQAGPRRSLDKRYVAADGRGRTLHDRRHT